MPISQKAENWHGLCLILVLMKQENELIKKVFDLVREMIILADEGQAEAKDDGCRLLYGVLQDSAYKIRHEAEREKEAHVRAGNWEG